MTIFGRLGTRPIINACGIYTDLGGSRLSPGVWAAMAESNRSFVQMADLLESSGRILASHVGGEAALVTPGAAASITLMVCAAMTGTDGAAGEQLPDTTGLRNEVVLQRGHRYKYDRQIVMTGARLVCPGTDSGTSARELDAAIGPRTAALFVPAHLDNSPGTVPLAEVIEIAERHGLPVLVDAAYMCWPLEIMASYVKAGAGLVCFSAKYFGGPNAGGFIVGTRRLIDAVTTNSFLRYESGPYRTYGRPFKLDRQTVVGVVAAFEEWLMLDHRARWAQLAAHVAELERAVARLPGIRMSRGHFTMDERVVPEPVNALVLGFEPAARLAAPVIAEVLAAGDPSIACVIDGQRLIFCLDLVTSDEIRQIGQRLRDVLEAWREDGGEIDLEETPP